MDGSEIIVNIPKYPVSRYIGCKVEIGRAVLFEEYCQRMQRKKGDVLREILEEGMRKRNIIR